MGKCGFSELNEVMKGILSETKKNMNRNSRLNLIKNATDYSSTSSGGSTIRYSIGENKVIHEINFDSNGNRIL